MITRDDEALLRDYCSGSEDAFRELALRYGAVVYAACLKSVRQPELAEDAAQAVFLVLARRAERLRVRTTLIPWLLATSGVVCRNFARAERRRVRFEVPLYEEIAAGETAVDSSIFEALEKLRGPDREAIVLRFVQGLSLAEVGRLQGISEDAARMRVKRGVSKLRRNFVPSLVLPPSLLGRLASPQFATALIQQLALKSTTMAITSSAAFVALVGVTGIGVAGAAIHFHSQPPTRSRPAATGVIAKPLAGRTASAAAPKAPSMAGYEIPTLNSEFTLTYRVFSDADPDGHKYVTVSSEGSDLVIQEAIEQSGQTNLTWTVLDQDQRSYLPNGLNSPNGHTNMWVTSSIYVAPFEFIGANLPTLHPLAELTGSGKQTGTIWTQPAKIYERGLLPEHPSVAGECSFTDRGKDGWALSSIVAGSNASAARVWMMSDFQQWNGITLPSIVTDTTYNNPTPGRDRAVRDWKRFILESKRSYALPQDLFRPEHYLKEGDTVEYKIPKRAGINLFFRYHDNGTTIEDQANAQDLIELSQQTGGR